MLIAMPVSVHEQRPRDAQSEAKTEWQTATWRLRATRDLAGVRLELTPRHSTAPWSLNAFQVWSHNAILSQ
jgi:hypothetical protein